MNTTTEAAEAMNTTTLTTATEAAEVFMAALERQCFYGQKVHETIDEYYGDACTVWYAGTGHTSGAGWVVRVDHGTYSLSWEIHQTGKETVWGTGSREVPVTVAVDRFVRDFHTPNS